MNPLAPVLRCEKRDPRSFGGPCNGRGRAGRACPDAFGASQALTIAGVTECRNYVMPFQPVVNPLLAGCKVLYVRGACALFGDPCGPPALAGACSGQGQAGDNMGDLPGRIPRKRCREASEKTFGCASRPPSPSFSPSLQILEDHGTPSPAGRQAAMASHAT